MGKLTAGGLVLVPFPFSDLSQPKVRPIVCDADVVHDATVCPAIGSMEPCLRDRRSTPKAEIDLIKRRLNIAAEEYQRLYRSGQS